MAKEDRELLAAKLRDGIAISRKRPYFLGFLDEAGAAFCEDLLKRERDVSFLFWGGYEEAERKILGMFPDYFAPEETAFPLAAVTFTYREEDRLSHRDFLGVFMSMGVERDVIGDILVGRGCCVAFFRKEMADYFSQGISKIGRVGVKVALGAKAPLPMEHEFQTLTGVVASPRLDCLVAFLSRSSREKAAGLITAGLVLLNHREILSTSERVGEGDVLSIRRQGKFIIDRLGPMTAKGRLSVQCRKYK